MEKYSLGIGDRFGHQGKYQLQAFLDLEELGVKVTPVWNKSFREHKTVGSHQQSVRDEADKAVSALNYQGSYLVDADHITMATVDEFLESSNFFTIDVAKSIGKPLEANDKKLFMEAYKDYLNPFKIEGINGLQIISESQLEEIGSLFYYASKKASAIYQKIAQAKKGNELYIEVSMDEVEKPQTPLQLFFILKFLADVKVPLNTIAPKFTGRFNKGVDYEGDLETFEKEFENYLHVISYAIKVFGLPENLRLSVHTGSDKFSLYPIMNRLIKKHNTGLHLKTAGTTWLEELIGMAEAGGSGLELVRKIAKDALMRYDDLTLPYATVLNINKTVLPNMKTIVKWDSKQYTDALRHNPENPSYNKSLRQLLHTAYKLAAQDKAIFLPALKEHETIIGKNVHKNILERHLKPLFL
jgi:hypothetical protein